MSSTPIEIILNKYKTTAESKDVEGHISIYDENVVVFDLWDQWSMQGRSAVRAMVSEWFGSLGIENVKIDFDIQQAMHKGDFAYGLAIVKYSAISALGETIRWLQNRMTIVLENKSGEWKIVHQHTSAPVGDDMKVKLRVET